MVQLVLMLSGITVVGASIIVMAVNIILVLVSLWFYIRRQVHPFPLQVCRLKAGRAALLPLGFDISVGSYFSIRW
jgi:hypothetical protein